MLEIFKDYKKIFIGIFLILLVACSSFFFVKSNKNEIKTNEQNVEKVEKLENKEEVEIIDEEIVPVKYVTVDIKGAVKKPGIYTLEEGSIINDAIKQAGLKSNATTKNINKASKEELMTLTGIGESKAIAIIKYREDNNGFKDISEIMNVSGIGEALYNKIKDSITV